MKTVTIFPNVKAQSKREMPLDDFFALLCDPPIRKNKEACSMFSAGTYGELRSAKNALRHTGNAIEFCAVIGDYDAGIVPMADAHARLAQANIAALFYTSASHTVAVPKWRVIAPLAAPCTPSDYRGIDNRLNAALGTILAPESKVAVQSFYFGRVRGVRYDVLSSDGRNIDTVEIAVAAEVEHTFSSEHNSTPDEYYRDIIRTGRGGVHDAMKTLASRWTALGLDETDIINVLETLMNDGEWRATDTARWKARYIGLRSIAAWAACKFGDYGRREFDDGPAPLSDEDIAAYEQESSHD